MNDDKFIVSNNGFFWGDEKLTKEQLISKYSIIKDKALEYQLKDQSDFNKWKEKRKENLNIYR